MLGGKLIMNRLTLRLRQKNCIRVGRLIVNMHYLTESTWNEM